MESHTRWTWARARADEVVGVRGKRMDVERGGVKGRLSLSGEIEGCCESLDDFVGWVWTSACVCDAGGMSPPAMVEVSAIVDWALIG